MTYAFAGPKKLNDMRQIYFIRMQIILRSLNDARTTIFHLLLTEMFALGSWIKKIQISSTWLIVVYPSSENSLSWLPDFT